METPRREEDGAEITALLPCFRCQDSASLPRDCSRPKARIDCDDAALNPRAACINVVRSAAHGWAGWLAESLRVPSHGVVEGSSCLIP